jgi:transposase-like protein
VQVGSGVDGAGWLAFCCDLVARGRFGVVLVTCDAQGDTHGGSNLA